MPRPQDPHLYGQPPPAKKKKTSFSDISGSLAFTSQLTSLLASSTTTPTTTGRPRPSKSKTDSLFQSVKIKRKHPPPSNQNAPLTLKPPAPSSSSSLPPSDLALSRAKLESKSALYSAMQRGDYIGKEYGLVDFDRKWAESNPLSPSPHSPSHSSSPEPEEEEEEATIEYTDEYNRTRLITPSQKATLDRAAASKIDLDKMAGRPISVPSDLIFGDTVQTQAFSGTEEMEELARKRDRSATPPKETYYDADWEVRTKGTGFYKFSQDGEVRKKEMEGLERERERTEREREKLEKERERRRREVEERRREVERRRREVGERRAGREAKRFLEGLEGVLGGGIGGEGEGGKEGNRKEQDEKEV
ncbi:hypothetical protein QBC40DRAFT_298290 [Triangularia verruculosa]|uniref:Uncharacterized protein n=1 Tax=Triangularia verruculosa TaxID=2587418 RepID=A0AAN6XDF6_9PEZI|nr:hypothetical protein QBC40DRAFT_298290 [Triangularia verruculosa]